MCRLNEIGTFFLRRSVVLKHPITEFNLKINYQSIRVGDAALRCPWHLCGGPFRRSLLVILANTIQPLQLTGGKFFILDYTKVIAVRTFFFGRVEDGNI